MKKIELRNPSVRLLATLGLTSKDVKWEQTCRSSTCSCASHDSGYNFVEVEESLVDGAGIHYYGGSVHSHGSTVLREEYIERFTAKGIPSNAPRWAYTLNTSRTECGYCYGKYVTVEQDGDFTVVKLMESRNSCVSMSGWFVEANIFATKDSVGNHTAEYRKNRFERLRNQRVAEFVEKGLSTDEAHRLFQIGKERWTREQEPLLIASAETLRQVSPYHLNRMATRYSGRALLATAREGGVFDLVLGMSHPRSVAFSKKALWVFHGEKVTEEEVIPVVSSTLNNSLAAAFANAE